MEKSTLKKIAKGLQKDFNTEIPKGSLNLSDLQNTVIKQIKIGADTIDTQEIELQLYYPNYPAENTYLIFR